MYAYVDKECRMLMRSVSIRNPKSPNYVDAVLLLIVSFLLVLVHRSMYLHVRQRCGQLHREHTLLAVIYRHA